MLRNYGQEDKFDDSNATWTIKTVTSHNSNDIWTVKMLSRYCKEQTYIAFYFFYLLIKIEKQAVTVV